MLAMSETTTCMHNETVNVDLGAGIMPKASNVVLMLVWPPEA